MAVERAWQTSTSSRSGALPRSALYLLERYYNNTTYSGLENHIANCYMNPLLQIFKYTTLIRNVSLSHVAGVCIHEDCLLCEMGFLFDMLEKAEGKACRATNFFKAYSSIPDGA
jgi:PAB-dependent poly(A)-specific ribonuclease subunit 2